ncbi:Inactive hydroxysteroid dehydrogenase-like protein 1 [Gracilariopsis chorda]|uniref:Inactive hydroxysteroid dehydrogenase-like protein 1 n=1 Tax=Gracilariopsis chorda TaxID=448386 RepID=A0A2V3IVQ9_9FLOR|nr:Inactive hydroxysteroid dehydrogenase-like protein 1 [Gracilariopsis chorda]|eukprot:PXF46236.1 Inactive hydroxysteroid dehydrogenase-like protein 1 [Gracilariopsis chorda]
MLDKYGPWAVITGASSGIGAEFARQLASQRFNVVLVARRKQRLQLLAAQLRTTFQVKTVVIVADLTSVEDLERVVQETSAIEVGLLINNAGMETHGPFLSSSQQALQQLIALNICAVTHLAHAYGNRMCAQKRGGIIFVSSLSSSGIPYLSAYSSSKAYVSTLAGTLHQEFRQHGVCCMALEPGFVESEMTLPKESALGKHAATSMMPVNVCVSEALRVFGTRTFCTPGFMNRLRKVALRMLPRSLAMWIVAACLRYSQSRGRINN